MKPIRILLVDDHALFRAGIRSLLGEFSEFQVVAEASNGFEALEKIGIHQPDVVLMDIGMPGMNGLEATALAVKEFPPLRVIILSIYDSEEYVDRALCLGAAGYLLKDSLPSELVFAIKTVAQGQTYLSPGISRQVVAKYQKNSECEPRPIEKLTPRQREILQLIGRGYTNKKIASTLGLSVKTVEMHRTQLMKRLHVHDVVSLVRCAVRLGFISQDY